MAKIERLEDLEIYRISKEISAEIYNLTKTFPQEEKFVIIPQLRRATLSIGANIAEAFGRFHYKDKVKFLYNARGSLYETLYFLEICLSNSYIKKGEFDQIKEGLDKLGIKLNNYIRVTEKQLNKKE